MGKACVRDPFWPTSQLELGLQYLKYQRGKWPVNPSPHEETYGSFDCRRCAGSQSLWGVRCCQHPAKAAARSPTKVTQHAGADAAGPLSAVSTFAISRWDGKIKMRHPRQQLSYHRGGEGFSLLSPLAGGTTPSTWSRGGSAPARRSAQAVSVPWTMCGILPLLPFRSLICGWHSSLLCLALPGLWA